MVEAGRHGGRSVEIRLVGKPDFYREEALLSEKAGEAPSGDAPANQELDFKRIVKHIFRYGFVEIADDILFALLVGVALGGILFLAIPSDLMSNDMRVGCPIRS